MTTEQLEKEFGDYKKENDRFHQRVIERIVNLEKDSLLQAERYRVILDNLTTITKKVESIEEKPGKKWESMTDKVIWLIVGAAITFILVHIGIG